MKYRTTIILMLLVFVTGGLIWILESKRSLEDRPRSRDMKVLNVNPERISYVSFYKDGVFIECMNSNGQWFINKPVSDRADNSVINQIIGVLKGLLRKEVITYSERNARDLSLSDYGLSDHSPWLVLGEREKRYKLRIGGDSPLKNAVYVRLDNESDVISTSTNVLSALPVRLEKIRDRQLFNGSADEVSRLEIKRHDRPTLYLVREGSEWIVHKPFITRADLLKVSTLLDHLFSIKITQFVSDSMSDPVVYGVGDDDAALRVVLWQGASQEAETAFFGKFADAQRQSVYVNRHGASSVYAVNRKSVEAINTSVADLRDSRLYFMAADKVKFIKMEDGDDVLELSKMNDGEWEIVKPQRWSADGRAVADLINRLNSLRIMAFMDGVSQESGEPGLSQPARTITIADHIIGSVSDELDQVLFSPSKRERVLKLSRAQPGNESVFARFDDHSQVYQVSVAAAMTISVDPLKYRDPVALSLSPSVVRSITIKKPQYEESVERDPSGAWKTVALGVVEVKQDVVDAVLAAIKSLRVSRFECRGAKNLAVYGLQEPVISITFGLTGEGGISKVLLIGSDAEDLGYYAMLQGQDVVFVLEREKVDLLARDLTR